MNKVVTVNLNGNAYSLEEPAYDALRAYLDGAQARLAGNPDRAEILADLEQAIADKCRRRLGPGRNVVGSAEMTTILEEMGPVEADPAGEGPSTGAAKDGPQPSGGAPRRLYLIREGAMLAGFLVPVFTAVSALLFVALVLVVLSLVMTGGVLNWALPADVPVWVAVIVVAIAYQALHVPLRAASRASIETTAGPHRGWIMAADAVLWLGFAALLFWIAYASSPDVRDLLDGIGHGWRHYVTAWIG